MCNAVLCAKLNGFFFCFARYRWPRIFACDKHDDRAWRRSWVATLFQANRCWWPPANVNRYVNLQPQIWTAAQHYPSRCPLTSHPAKCRRTSLKCKFYLFLLIFHANCMHCGRRLFILDRCLLLLHSRVRRCVTACHCNIEYNNRFDSRCRRMSSKEPRCMHSLRTDK